MPTETKPEAKGGVSLRGSVSEADRKAAAALMGSVSTERKAAAARANGAKSKPGPGQPPKSLEELACTCGAGMALEGHKWDCPRGQAIKRRAKAGTL